MCMCIFWRDTHDMQILSFSQEDLELEEEESESEDELLSSSEEESDDEDFQPTSKKSTKKKKAPPPKKAGKSLKKAPKPTSKNKKEKKAAKSTTNGSAGVNYSNEKRLRVWCFIKKHGLDEETQARSEERKAQDA